MQCLERKEDCMEVFKHGSEHLMKVNHERQKEQESPVKQTEKAKKSIL